MSKKKIIPAIIRRISLYLNKGFILLFGLFPINRNQIVFESEGDYADNAKVFSDYLIKNNYTRKYKLIWIVHETNKYPKIDNVVFVSRYRFINIKTDYYLATSKFFIFTHPYWFRKTRKKQIVINTTHSVSQLKASQKQQKNIPFDYVLACSDYCAEIKKEVFGVDDNQLLILGMPRIDIINKQEKLAKSIIPNYGGQKIILIMETFKQSKDWSDSKKPNKYSINVIKNSQDLVKFDKYLQENNLIVLNKIHHLQDMTYLNKVNTKNIYYLTDDILYEMGISTNNLLNTADILLTDYSSVFYEYLLLDRPIGFLIGDINDYERGFITNRPLDEMPGEKIRSLDELTKFINDVTTNKDKYKKERKRVVSYIYKYKDNKNSKRLYDWINNK